MPNNPLIVESLRVIEGTSLYSFPNASTDFFGTFDIDLGNVEAVNALNVKYPRAWRAMYGITLAPYIYTPDNAARLKKAVEFWVWLVAGNSGYVDAKIETEEELDNLVPVNVVALEEQERIPYSDYTTGSIRTVRTGSLDLQDRIPPFNKWNAPVFRTGIVDAYVTFDANAGTPTTLDVFLRDAVTHVVLETKTVVSFPSVVKFDARPVYAAFDESARLIRWVYDNRVDEYNRPLPAYIPFVFNGGKLFAAEVLGGTVADAATGDRYVSNSNAERLYTSDYLTKNEYEGTHSKNISTREWGNEFATGKHTF